ncbi:MAG TPA: ABC transporter ATP-binding protein [Acidimicrobiales bacterium]
MAGVTFSGVTKRFGDVVAVDSFNLDVVDRDFLVLLGPSGCGKSTVLRMVAGLERPTAGTVSIGGAVVNDVPPKNRDIAMVFQSYALYPHKTTYGNIEFPLKTRGIPKEQRETAVKEAAGLLGLTPLLDRKPGAMSGGQRQRVALARAIVRQPAVFLMDEPLSNLDAKLRSETRAELIALHDRLNATFVYVTHDQVEAMTMASTVAVMSAGVLQQVGKPQEMYDKPANTFVAGFMGTPPMNLFPAGALEPGGHTVGVRPEHLELTEAGDGEGPAATVVLVEELGHERHVTCRLPEGGNVVARVAGHTSAPTEGSRVLLSAEARHRHRFDAETGLRIDK